jgi:protein TonB
VIDTKGKPTAPCLVKAAGFDLDQQSAEAVMQYRFKPALKDGKPIPVRMQIERGCVCL